MSAISNLIFKNAYHKMSSPYGNRKPIGTSAGTTSSFHNGTDYSTNGKKIAQYAIEDGYIFAAAKSNNDGALYVWVIYPRIKKAFLHYHLDSYKVKAGQKVVKGTLLGYTGQTGKATGIHLHLGVRDIAKLTTARIENMTWNALRSCNYINPEGFTYTAPTAKPAAKPAPAPAKTQLDSFLHSRGYFQYGDTHANIGKIASFLRKNFPKYTNEAALGNKFGPNLLSAVKTFQKNAKLTVDGKIGPKTLAELVKYGFRY